MLEQGIMLPAQINDRRLSLEISAIVTLARHFVQLLRTRDPRSENVRLGKFGVVAFGARRRERIIWTPGPRARRRHQITGR